LLVGSAQFPITVGLADIDEFLNVNQTYGHTTGDFACALLGMGPEEALI